MTMTFAAPRSVAPLDARTVLLACDWAKSLDTITGWAAYVDEEFGLTDEERALWRALQTVRDALGDMSTSHYDQGTS